ncbi:hypothetical protein GCM10010082_11900 [Kushneria pakistanensis]|uniref:Calcineurin-like phosphoesterase domain-containing protein n=1 Tax=Kushneria pakistanensis TaxID=1508770 RepID=A0ABQ3FFH5_9GAMM|nr:metallophosphoesterase [Kushneria pakistanensis]GHC21738.1 hypothetical protein GCM10010082_11900 [Kushneria pakistanensis]
MLIAQITDLHIRCPGERAYGVVETHRLLPPVVAALNALNALNALDPRPDVVLITGDATDLGHPQEYAALAEP